MVRDIDYSQGGDRIQVMNADGSDLHLLLAGEGAQWSPNGDRIVFQLSIAHRPAWPEGSEVWTVAPDGSNRIKVFDSDRCDMGAVQDAGDALPVWAPNGTQVAYNACRGWVIANADGTGEAQPIDRLFHRSWGGGGLSGYDLFYGWWTGGGTTLGPSTPTAGT